MSAKTLQRTPLTLLDKVFVGLLIAVFGGIVLHAPISVGFGTLFPSAELFIKSWKEILILVATVIMGILLIQKKRFDLLKHPVVLVIAAYAALHVLLLPLYSQGVLPSIVGLMVGLRYLLFFVLVFVAISLYPQLRRTFVVTFFVGAFVVAAFALLQVFVLPPDVLKYIGYNGSTIASYLTVDQNPEYVRINSTLRGPNPLGAYAVIVLSLLFAFWLRGKHSTAQRQMLAVSVVVIGSFVALWASYSRSALIAAFVALGLIVAATIGRRLSRRVWIAVFVVVFALMGGLFVARDTDFVSNVILHENQVSGSEVNSNDGHVESLQYGVDRLVHQPFGAGIGSTGSASQYGDQPTTIENQFLFIAHEVGWIGLALFIYLTLLVLRRLWHERQDWLALGVFASGIGMIVIGLLLPVWVDDTVAIIWWGLAALVLAGKGNDGRTIVKETKRTA